MSRQAASTRRILGVLIPLLGAALACSLPLQARPTATPTRVPTSTPSPTATPTPLTAAEVVDSLNLPAGPDGQPPQRMSFEGPDLASSDPAWGDFFAASGVDPSAFSLAVAFQPGEEGMGLSAGAVVAPGWDWIEALSGLASATSAGAEVAFEAVDLEGIPALQASAAQPGGPPPVYYVVQGDLLLFASASSPDEAAAILSPATDADEASAPAPSSGDASPPPSPFLIVTLTEIPQLPVCVGEPIGRQRITVIVIEGDYGVPSPFYTLTSFGLLGSTVPSALVTGPSGTFFYQAERFGFGSGERVRIEARSATGGFGLIEVPFPVQHCLNGLWQDGDRVLKVDQDVAGRVTADILEGTLICGATGQAFSGPLRGDQLQGEDLLVCNPEACVEAGFQEETTVIPYEARVSDDGMLVTFDWTRLLYDFETDAQDNVIGCVESGTEPRSFTITRLVFGDPP